MRKSISGIFFTDGQTWFEQRRFALRNLRDFGFGRRQDELESEIEDEILNLIDLLKKGPKYEFEQVTDNTQLISFLFINNNQMTQKLPSNRNTMMATV